MRAAAAAHAAYMREAASLNQQTDSLGASLQRVAAELRRTPWGFVLPASIAAVAVVWLQFLRAVVQGRIVDSLSGMVKATIVLAQPGDDDSGGTSQASNPLALLSQWEGRWSLLYVLGLSLAEWACSTSRDWLFDRAKQARLLHSRALYLATMMNQEQSFHQSHRASELVQRLAMDPETLDDFVIHALERLLRGLTALAALAYMLLVDWQLMVLGIALRIPFMLQFVEKTVQLTAAYERLQRDAHLKVSEARRGETRRGGHAMEAGRIAEPDARGVKPCTQPMLPGSSSTVA